MSEDEESESMSPNTRVLVAEYEKLCKAYQLRHCYVDKVCDRVVFVNYVPESWPADKREKLQYKAHVSHSPVHLAKYNRIRRYDFDKGLPAAILKLQTWYAEGGCLTDPRFLSDGSDEVEDSEDEESESSYQNIPEEFTMLGEPSSQQSSCPVKKISFSDPTEEATLVSDDSLVGINTSADGKAVNDFVAKEDADDANAAIREVMDEIIDRVVKVHDKVQAVRLKWISLTKRG